MDDRKKTKSQLIEELKALRQQVAELEQRRAASREDRLKLAIVDRAPFTMWACNRNFEIVLWSANCEGIYGHCVADAIGQNYLELFVSPPERRQSEMDCLRIIDEDYVQTNFLAYDVAKDKTTRTVLTNCFRVWDEELGQYLQAELALEVSDLELRKEEHRRLREVGIERLVREDRIKELRREKLLNQLQHRYFEKIDVVVRQERDIEEWRTKIRRMVGAEEAEEATRSQLEDIKRRREAIENRRKELSHRIAKATSIEDLEGIEYELERGW